ncbi:MAG: hypothetical protein KC708_05795 [Anaerolineae bacterium]|nr:hypothetical protein [Anaerolineae bacterium]
MQALHPLVVTLMFFTILFFGIFSLTFGRTLTRTYRIRRDLLQFYKDELKNGFGYTGKAIVEDVPAVPGEAQDYEDKLHDLGYRFVCVIEEHNGDAISWNFVGGGQSSNVIASITISRRFNTTGVGFRTEFTDNFILYSTLGSGKPMDKDDFLFQSISTSLDATYFAHLASMKDLSKVHGPAHSFESMHEIVALDKRDTESNAEFVIKNVLRMSVYSIVHNALIIVGFMFLFGWPWPSVFDLPNLSTAFFAAGLATFALAIILAKRTNLYPQPTTLQKKHTE